MGDCDVTRGFGSIRLYATQLSWEIVTSHVVLNQFDCTQHDYRQHTAHTQYLLYLSLTLALFTKLFNVQDLE